MHAVLSPLRACLRQAVADGLIQHNPARDIRVRKPDAIVEDDEHDVRALNREQLATFLASCPTGTG